MIKLDLIIYLLINAFLVVFALLAYELWGMLGAFGGVIGGILSYLTFQEPSLVFRSTYDAVHGIWIHESIAMGFFAWVPVILTFLNFMVILTHKKK